MRKNYKNLMILVLIITLLVPIGCARDEEPVPQPQQPEEPRVELPAVEDMILSAESWQEEYPMIYESFIRTARMQDNKVEDTGLGGLMPISYLDKYPEIKVLYEGIGFSKEYYIARGHYYSLEDVINTSRPKPGASCLGCKTADFEKLWVENGQDLFRLDFYETSQKVENAISCYNCHRNEPEGGIQITAPHFAEGVRKLDQEPNPGTMACAQCHVEYYFDGNTGEIVLPWDNGLGVDEIESYFDEIDFADWIHPRTGTPLIKVQHPEFETYTGSVHDRMGVSCADCHMPRVVEEGEEYLSHWAKSPLKTVTESCLDCHGGEPQALIDRTQAIQQEVKDMTGEVGMMLVDLIEGFAELLDQRKLEDEEVIRELRSLHRKAQYRWDFIFVENSTGFHNAAKARETLNRAKEYAQQALDIIAEYQ